MNVEKCHLTLEHKTLEKCLPSHRVPVSHLKFGYEMGNVVQQSIFLFITIKCSEPTKNVSIHHDVGRFSLYIYIYIF